MGSLFLSGEGAWSVVLAGVLADMAIKSTLLLAAAFAAAAFLRRHSAAVRHLVWVAAMGGMLILPLLSVVLPGWNVLPAWAGVRTKIAAVPEGNAPAVAAKAPAMDLALERDWQAMARRSDGGGAADRAIAPAVPVVAFQEPAARFEWRAAIVWAWGLGAILALLSAVAGLCVMAARKRRGVAMTAPVWRQLLVALGELLGIRRQVGLVRSKACDVPMTFGVLRPTILVSQDAEEWPAEKRRIVLLHEMAHVRRWDCLALMLAQVVRGLYWFQPLAWLAAGRVRAECERACDDVVLKAGAKGSAYASMLLAYASVDGVPAGALAMARRSTLEGRLLAIMDGARNRRGLTRAVVAVVLAVMIGLAAGLACLRAQTTDSPKAGLEPAMTMLATMPKPDYSTPQKAALTYFRAVRLADWPAVRDAVLASQSDLDRIKAQLEAQGAEWDLNAAALKAFGPRGDRFSDSYIPVEISDGEIAAFSAERVKTIQDGDIATVSAMVRMTAPDPRVTQVTEVRLKLVKTDKFWRILREKDEQDQASNLSLKRDQWKARLFAGMAADIRAGKYKTFEDAAKARDEAFAHPNFGAVPASGDEPGTARQTMTVDVHNDRVRMSTDGGVVEAAVFRLARVPIEVRGTNAHGTNLESGVNGSGMPVNGTFLERQGGKVSVRWAAKWLIADNVELTFAEDARAGMTIERTSGAQGAAPPAASRPLAPATAPASTLPDNLQTRYVRIFSRLDEKRDGDRRLENMTKAHVSKEQLVTEQRGLTVSLWNKIEAAAKEVAVRHGQESTIPDDTPKLPQEVNEVALNEILRIIHARMVIPLDDKMEAEVIATLNAAYAKEKAAPATPPAATEAAPATGGAATQPAPASRSSEQTLTAPAKTTTRKIGKIVDADGKPIVGAEVLVLRAGPWTGFTYPLEQEIVARTQSGTDGGVQIDGAGFHSLDEDVAAGMFSMVTARKRDVGFGYSHSLGLTKDGKIQEIVLRKTGQLEGLVVDESGQPIAEAQVRADLFHDEQTSEPDVLGCHALDWFAARTGKDGRFVIPGVPTEFLAEFTVRAAGRATVATERRVAGSSPTPQFRPGQEGIRIVLPSQCRIEGLALDKATGKPVAGVKLIAMRQLGLTRILGSSDRLAPPAFAMTDKEGRFTLNALQPGNWKVALAQQWISDRVEPGEWVTMPVLVEVAAGKSQSMRLELSPGELVEVALLAATTGKPVRGELSPDQETRRWGAAQTSDDKGIVRMRLLPGEYAFLASDWPPKVAYADQEVPRRLYGHLDLTVEQGKSQRLEVRLSDAAAQPAIAPATGGAATQPATAPATAPAATQRGAGAVTGAIVAENGVVVLKIGDKTLRFAEVGYHSVEGVKETAVVMGFDRDGKKLGELALEPAGWTIRAVGNRLQVSSGGGVLEADRLEVREK